MWHDKFRVLQHELMLEGFQVVPFESGWLIPQLAQRFGAAGFTWYKTIYIKSDYWDTKEGYEILRHEAVHARDIKRFGFFAFYATYVMFLDIGMTWRAIWEWRAYRESLRCEFEQTGAVSKETVEWVVKQFSAPMYLFMLPIPCLIRWLCNREIRRLQSRR